jgi:hypothetical protein
VDEDLVGLPVLDPVDEQPEHRALEQVEVRLAVTADPYMRATEFEPVERIVDGLVDA